MKTIYRVSTTNCYESTTPDVAFSTKEKASEVLKMQYDRIKENNTEFNEDVFNPGESYRVKYWSDDFGFFVEESAIIDEIHLIEDEEITDDMLSDAV